MQIIAHLIKRGVGQAFYFKKHDFALVLKVKARTRPEILRVVLGPCAQCCPCEALEQKMGPKPKSKLTEIEL